MYQVHSGILFSSRWQDSNLRPPVPKTGALTHCATPWCGSNAPYRVRTCDPQLRRPALSPTELRMRGSGTRGPEKVHSSAHARRPVQAREREGPFSSPKAQQAPKPGFVPPRGFPGAWARIPLGSHRATSFPVHGGFGPRCRALPRSGTCKVLAHFPEARARGALPLPRLGRDPDFPHEGFFPKEEASCARRASCACMYLSQGHAGMDEG